MKKIGLMICIFVFGVGIGLFAGVLVGRSMSDGQVSPTPSVTGTPTLTVTSAPTPPVTGTPTPEPTAAMAPTEALVPPETMMPTPSVTGTPTLEPTAAMSPQETMIPQETMMPTPSVTGTSTPTVTSAPAPPVTGTPTPTVTSAPTPTGAPDPADSPTSSPTATPMPTEKPEENKEENSSGFYGALHVEGIHLVGEDGTPVQLRGISTHGIGWFPQYVNAEMIAQTNREWGCNVFRLAMYTAESNGYCTSGDGQKENLKKIIDTGVQAAVEEDMYIIIDWHVLNDRDPNLYKEEAKAFFAEMAQKYADVPNVIYEICNEPNGGISWQQIKQYALEVIPVIRQYAPEAVIIVGTPTWSQDVDVAAADPITEYDNIMYALHFYAATHTDSLRNKCKTALAQGLPVFVSEYGICDASGNGRLDTVQADKWIELLDSYGISHVMWSLCNKAEAASIISSGSSKTSNLTSGDLSATGKWFVEMMQEAGLGSDEWIVPGGAGNTGNTADAGSTGTAAPTAEDLFVIPEGISLTVSNSWVSENGYGLQLDIRIQNTGTAEETDWVRAISVKEGVELTVSQYWCSKVTMDGGVLTLLPEEYNKTIAIGGEVSGIGIILEVR